MTDAQWEDGLTLKLHGARRLTIRAWDPLKASNGSVVLISGSATLDPKPGFAAVAAVNAAIIALAKAFAEQGIKDGVQVNSVVPGAVMTGRRQSFFEKWAPAHNRSRHQSFRESRRDCRFDGLPGITCGEVDHGSFCAYGRRRNQRYLGPASIHSLGAVSRMVTWSFTWGRHASAKSDR
jgi:NAD(P)-dependent dehydrogenase (short-subunit alcohol dehydrogenase family)